MNNLTAAANTASLIVSKKNSRHADKLAGRHSQRSYRHASVYSETTYRAALCDIWRNADSTVTTGQEYSGRYPGDIQITLREGSNYGKLLVVRATHSTDLTESVTFSNETRIGDKIGRNINRIPRHQLQKELVCSNRRRRYPAMYCIIRRCLPVQRVSSCLQLTRPKCGLRRKNLQSINGIAI